MTKSKLGQKLRDLRRANNYTQDYIADVLGVVRQTYSNYETGKRNLDAETIYKLAEVYHISVDDLMRLAVNPDEDHEQQGSDGATLNHRLMAFITFLNDPVNQKKYRGLSATEKEMLYYFQLIPDDEKREMIAFAKIKAEKYT